MRIDPQIPCIHNDEIEMSLNVILQTVASRWPSYTDDTYCFLTLSVAPDVVGQRIGSSVLSRCTGLMCVQWPYS